MSVPGIVWRIIAVRIWPWRSHMLTMFSSPLNCFTVRTIPYFLPCCVRDWTLKQRMYCLTEPLSICIEFCNFIFFVLEATHTQPFRDYSQFCNWDQVVPRFETGPQTYKASTLPWTHPVPCLNSEFLVSSFRALHRLGIGLGIWNRKPLYRHENRPASMFCVPHYSYSGHL